MDDWLPDKAGGRFQHAQTKISKGGGEQLFRKSIPTHPVAQIEERKFINKGKEWQEGNMMDKMFQTNFMGWCLLCRNLILTIYLFASPLSLNIHYQLSHPGTILHHVGSDVVIHFLQRQEQKQISDEHEKKKSSWGRKCKRWGMPGLNGESNCDALFKNTLKKKT